jgi:molybdopterin converting factor small subunit
MAAATVTVTLRGVGTLARRVKPPIRREVPAGTTVRELALLDGVEEDAVMLVFVNKERSTLDRALEEGDEVVLYPIVAGG